MVAPAPATGFQPWPPSSGRGALAASPNGSTYCPQPSTWSHRLPSRRFYMLSPALGLDPAAEQTAPTADALSGTTATATSSRSPAELRGQTDNPPAGTENSVSRATAAEWSPVPGGGHERVGRSALRRRRPQSGGREAPPREGRSLSASWAHMPRTSAQMRRASSAPPALRRHSGLLVMEEPTEGNGRGRTGAPEAAEPQRRVQAVAAGGTGRSQVAGADCGTTSAAAAAAADTAEAARLRQELAEARAAEQRARRDAEELRGQLAVAVAVAQAARSAQFATAAKTIGTSLGTPLQAGQVYVAAPHAGAGPSAVIAGTVCGAPAARSQDTPTSPCSESPSFAPQAQRADCCTPLALPRGLLQSNAAIQAQRASTGRFTRVAAWTQAASQSPKRANSASGMAYQITRRDGEVATRPTPQKSRSSPSCSIRHITRSTQAVACEGIRLEPLSSDTCQQRQESPCGVASPVLSRSGTPTPHATTVVVQGQRHSFPMRACQPGRQCAIGGMPQGPSWGITTNPAQRAVVRTPSPLVLPVHPSVPSRGGASVVHTRTPSPVRFAVQTTTVLSPSTTVRFISLPPSRAQVALVLPPQPDMALATPSGDGRSKSPIRMRSCSTSPRSAPGTPATAQPLNLGFGSPATPQGPLSPGTAGISTLPVAPRAPPTTIVVAPSRPKLIAQPQLRAAVLSARAVSTCQGGQLGEPSELRGSTPERGRGRCDARPSSVGRYRQQSSVAPASYNVVGGRVLPSPPLQDPRGSPTPRETKAAGPVAMVAKAEPQLRTFSRRQDAQSQLQPRTKSRAKEDVTLSGAGLRLQSRLSALRGNVTAPRTL